MITVPITTTIFCSRKGGRIEQMMDEKNLEFENEDDVLEYEVQKRVLSTATRLPPDLYYLVCTCTCTIHWKS